MPEVVLLLVAVHNAPVDDGLLVSFHCSSSYLDQFAVAYGVPCVGLDRLAVHHDGLPFLDIEIVIVFHSHHKQGSDATAHLGIFVTGYGDAVFTYGS